MDVDRVGDHVEEASLVSGELDSWPLLFRDAFFVEGDHDRAGLDVVNFQIAVRVGKLLVRSLVRREVLACASASFLAEMSVKSPRNLFIFIICIKK